MPCRHRGVDRLLRYAKVSLESFSYYLIVHLYTRHSLYYLDNIIVCDNIYIQILNGVVQTEARQIVYCFAY